MTEMQEQEVIKDAFQEDAYPTEESRFMGDTERMVPIGGISKFELAVFMAMQGFCQWSSIQPQGVLMQSIAKSAVEVASATLLAIQRERELYFPQLTDPEDTLDF